MNVFNTPLINPASVLGLSPGNESSNPPGKTRSACNRCHSQKLKCVRKEEQVKCERCLRLKTACRFGPRTPRASTKQKPPERTANGGESLWFDSVSGSEPIMTPNTNPNSTLSDMSNCDWPLSSVAETGLAEDRELMYTELCSPMQGNSCIPQDTCWPDPFLDSRGVSLRNLDSSNNLGLTTINDNVMDLQSSTFPADIPDSYLTSTRTGDHENNDRSSLAPKSFVRKLASLNIALHECSEKLPTMATIVTGREIPPGHSNDTMHGSRKTTFFVIDELFRLTSEFIDVMKCFPVSECETGTTPSSTDPCPADSASTISLTSCGEQMSHSSLQMTRTTRSPPSRSFSHMGEATMFMVVSCHCRITELYSSVFELMQACIEHKLPPRIDKHWAVILPNLQFGSVTTPPVQVDIDSPLSPSNSSMYMLMFTMLSSQLWEQLVEVMRAGCAGEVSTSPGSLSRSTLVDTMWDRVTEKNNDLSRIIDSTRHLLQRYSVTAEL